MPDFLDRAGTASVADVTAWEVFDSRAHPTIAVRVQLTSGAVGIASTPTGASVGQFEAADLRDPQRFDGLGVQAAVDWVDQRRDSWRDRSLWDLAATETWPANVQLAFTVAAARAHAGDLGLELWQYLAGDEPVNCTLPVPMANIFSGGRHAEGGGVVQDYLVIPTAACSFAEAMGVIWRVRRAAAALVEGRYGRLQSKLVADEGGLALPTADVDEPLRLLTQAIESTGAQAAIALDVAANEVPDEVPLEQFVAAWVETYPVLSIEDLAGDNDLPAWRRQKGMVDRIQVVGDDLTATRVDRIELAATESIVNAVLIKPNQVGSLHAAHEALLAARGFGLATIVSARSGDTEDTAIADIAVGWGAGQIKIGSIMRSERLAKYNRLLEIERRSGLQYAGWKGR